MANLETSKGCKSPQQMPFPTKKQMAILLEKEAIKVDDGFLVLNIDLWILNERYPPMIMRMRCGQFGLLNVEGLFSSFFFWSEFQS